MLQERELDGYKDYSGERCYGGRHPGNSGPSDGRLHEVFSNGIFEGKQKRGKN